MSPDEAAQREQQRQAQACINRGLKPQTEAFYNCQMQEQAATDKKMEELKRMDEQQQFQRNLDTARRMPKPPPQ